MRTFLAHRKNEKLLVLGLTKADLHKLKAGERFAVDLPQLGLPWQGKVLLVYGNTDYALPRDLPPDDLTAPETDLYRPPPPGEDAEPDEG
jgi:hypothetical protein